MFLECLSQLLHTLIKRLRLWNRGLISCCKKSSLLLNIWFYERGTLCVTCLKCFIPVHPVSSFVASFSFDISFCLISVYFFMCVCQTCLRWSQIVSFKFSQHFKEDCAWVRKVIYLYATVYLATILNFVVTKWTSCAVYGAVLSHIVSNLCVHYWFVIVCSVLNPKS